MKQEILFDVIVIGGGPAGSAVATLLADQDYKVALIEKMQHPRFHIGESLLPMSMPLLKELGVYDEVASVGKLKAGASFFSHIYSGTTKFLFKNAMNKTNPTAFQVKRAEFDTILFRNSEKHGVLTFENAEVTDCVILADELTEVSVSMSDEKQKFKAKFIIDATGRDAFLGTKNKFKQANPKHRSAAIYAHFENANNFPDLEQGNIGIYWFEYGWFWLIPFSDGTVSVGVVAKPEYFKQRSADLNDFLLGSIGLCPQLKMHLGNAKQLTTARATGNYSYHSSAMFDKNYLLLGDAFAFVDPVFSSGVHIALRSAFSAAKAVDKVLRKPKFFNKYLAAHQRFVQRGINNFTWMIYHMLEPEFHFLFMHPRNIFNMEAAIISILSGDVFDKTPWKMQLFIFKCLYYVMRKMGFSKRQERSNEAFPTD